MNKKISTVIFGLALISFLLPWVNLRINVRSYGFFSDDISNFSYLFSGFDLAIGKTIHAFGMATKTPSEGSVTTAFIAAIAGILSGFIIKNDQGKGIAAAICGGIGSISLYLLKSKPDNDMIAQAVRTININMDYQFSFWVAMVLFLLGCALNISMLTGHFDKMHNSENN